jgi:hypothetical protein
MPTNQNVVYAYSSLVTSQAQYTRTPYAIDYSNYDC